MQLEEIKGVSKKTNKEFVGYCIRIGEYKTPIFFPSKIELMYIKDYLTKLAHQDFNKDEN